MIITTDKPKIENESIYLNKYYIWEVHKTLH